jgi:hypothetical protein
LTEENQPLTPPQDTGAPDSVEQDGLALNSAEDLDEDRLRVDPLEAGIDPPERWSGVDKYGMTPYEQAHPRPLGDRLAEEEPDIQPDTGALAPGNIEPAGQTAEPAVDPDDPAGVAEETLDRDTSLDDEVLREAIGRGQAADEAGGSMASAERTPRPPD